MFVAGLFIGKDNVDIIDFRDMEPKRVYIQTFKVADEEKFRHVLVKEYEVDFIELW
jgi:hypothetical protein